MEKKKLGHDVDDILKKFVPEKKEKNFLGRQVEEFSMFLGKYLPWGIAGKIVFPILTKILLAYVGWKIIFKPMLQIFGFME